MLDLIKQEHRIFSDYIKASFPDNLNNVASSLVCGDDFIHQYALRHENSLLIVLSFSKHGNASFHSACANVELVEAMESHLNVRTTTYVTVHINSHLRQLEI